MSQKRQPAKSGQRHSQKNSRPTGKAKAKAAKKGSLLKDTLVIIISAVALAMLLKTFIVDTRWVPTTSMIPTIEISDRLIVSKLSYAFGHTPERGDIVVFKPPAELGESSDLVKRVIGLPGDTIQVTGGLVYINGAPYEEDYLAEQPTYEFGPVTVPEDSYLVLGDNRNPSYDSHRWQNPYIPASDIKAKAICRYWPLNRIGGIYDHENTVDQ